MFQKLISFIDAAPDEVLSKKQPDYAAATSRLGITFGLFLFTLVALAIVWWSGINIPPTEYQRLTVDDHGKGKVSYLQTMADPNYSPSRIQKWTTQALSDTLTFNFTDINSRLGAASVYYTPGAQASMRNAIEQQEVIERVRNGRLAVALTPLSSPYVINSYVVELGGTRTLYWNVEAPVILNYTGASTSEVRGMRIYLRIKQVPTTESPDGLAISGFHPAPIALN